jgi:hypothetical protein
MKVETESIESEKSAVLAGRLDRFVRRFLFGEMK